MTHRPDFFDRHPGAFRDVYVVEQLPGGTIWAVPMAEEGIHPVEVIWVQTRPDELVAWFFSPTLEPTDQLELLLDLEDAPERKEYHLLCRPDGRVVWCAAQDEAQWRPLLTAAVHEEIADDDGEEVDGCELDAELMEA